MPEDGEVAQWDFLTLIDWWNLYILPAVLALVVAALIIRRRIRPASTKRLEAAPTIQRIGLIHLVLGLRAIVHLAQELRTLGTMGIFQSNPVSNLITALSVLINPLLGVGLWRLNSKARRGAIFWYLLWSLIAAWVTYWIWYYRAPVTLADWPDHVVGKATPWFLLVVMLRPQTRRMFASRLNRASGADSRADAQPNEPVMPQPPKDWPVVGSIVIVLLVIACSTLFVDVADWVYRAATEQDLGSPQ
jgi:hypothetical protein